MKNQPKQITTNILYGRGYTINQAAIKVGRTAYHVSQVVNGKRSSKKLTEQLLALPFRTLKLSEAKPALEK